MSIINVLPKDIENTPIVDGISSIPYIQIFTVVSGGWTEISTNCDTKNIILQSREVQTWFFATESGTNAYLTLRNGAALQSRFVSVSGTLIGWVSSDYDITMELGQGR
jgi:hypothetical protein